jgi:hypothetical protein
MNKILDESEMLVKRDQLKLHAAWFRGTVKSLCGKTVAEPTLSAENDCIADCETLENHIAEMQRAIEGHAHAKPQATPTPAPIAPAAATPAQANTAPAAKPAKKSLDAQCEAVKEDRKAKRASEAALAAEALTLVKAGKMNLTQAVAFVKSKQAGK